ncbi:unnamed protein product, partial [Mesorhabditis spiculigera]
MPTKEPRGNFSTNAPPSISPKQHATSFHGPSGNGGADFTLVDDEHHNHDYHGYYSRSEHQQKNEQHVVQLEKERCKRPAATGQPKMRSVQSDTPPLNIQIKLFYIQIVGLEAQTQVLSTIYQIKMKWRDPRLAWNPEDYGGIKQIYLSESLLWLPDTNVGTATGASITRPDEIRALQVLNTGRVKWPTQYFTENICRMQVSKFPFDTQICTIPFLTWAYEAKFLNLTGSMSDIQIQNQGNGEWDLIDLTTIYTSYGQGEDGIAKMNYQLTLRRVPNFYVYVIAIPCFILTMLSAVGMFWTPNYKAEQLTKT